jgi:hypothetical protein
MSSDKLSVRLGVMGNFWDRRPQYSIAYDNCTIETKQFSLNSGETEYLEFDIEPSGESGCLAISLLNKTNADTIENADKSGILKDMTIDIASLEVDGINLGSLLHSESEYRPQYPDGQQGESVLKEHVTLGWNGTWSIQWSNPFFLWLLEKL